MPPGQHCFGFGWERSWPRLNKIIYSSIYGLMFMKALKPNNTTSVSTSCGSLSLYITSSLQKEMSPINQTNELPRAL